MSVTKSYSAGLKVWAVGLVLDAREREPEMSLNKLITRIGSQIGVNPDTLRGWVKQRRVDDGELQGAKTLDKVRIKGLEREIEELRRVNEILVAASNFFSAGTRPARTTVTRFVDEYRQLYGVKPICRVLKKHGFKIAPSSYFAAKTRPPSAWAIQDAARVEIIEAMFWDKTRGNGVAGVRKMWHYLKRDGYQIPRCAVERIMRSLGLRGAVRGGYKTMTTRKSDVPAARSWDRVKRDFHADRPNQLWVVDFTYVPTWEGTGFAAFVQDVYSRRIVGWRVASRMPVDLPLDALEMALWVRARDGHNPVGTTHHSDAGVQYTSIRYVDRLEQAGMIISIGTVGDSYDNAMAETLNGQYKTECVKREGPFRTVDNLELATCTWVEYYNRYRIHSSLDYATPIEYETAYYDNSPQSQAASR